MSQTSMLLNQLGVGGRYRGFQWMIRAIDLAREDPDRLLRLTKTIYPVVAQEFGTSWYCVERNLRTIVENCWEHGNRKLLQELAGYPLVERPSNGEFLDILTNYLLRKENRTETL